MTDLYLCVPDDAHYYMYCDEAYKYNERARGERDSGFDVYCSEETYMNRGDTAFLKFGITSSCAIKYVDGVIFEPRAFWLMPRSSISKTPFICANSKGLIDLGYRGPLMGAVKMLFGDNLETIKAGTRLFQIVSGSAKPWRQIKVVRTVEEMPKPRSLRGSGGFGSTGVGYDSELGVQGLPHAPNEFSSGSSVSTGTGSGTGTVVSVSTGTGNGSGFVKYD